MKKLIVVNDSCEYCADEYIETMTKKLEGTPDDQRKTNAINRILHGANRASCKPVVVIGGDLFDNGQHKICANHLYKMIDAIKEYEDESKEPE